MPAAKVSERDLIGLIESIGTEPAARRLGMSAATLAARRRRIEARTGRAIVPPDKRTNRVKVDHPERVHLSVKTGVVLVGSDAHFWPGDDSPAFRGFVKFVKEMRPVAVIMNGDAFDGASISRHPPIGWAEQPTVQQEIEACQEALSRIEKAKPVKCKLIWSLGNHDARFETRIATVAPEYAKVHGAALQDHFPAWEPCWSTWINFNTADQNSGVVVKHRFKGGIHAPHNNTLWAGTTMVTGHLHSAKVQPISDYRGTRYGVDTGCLADSYGRQFRDYTEDNPRNWRSGFCVLTFKDGALLQPELVLAWDENTVQFRGELIRV